MFERLLWQRHIDSAAAVIPTIHLFGASAIRWQGSDNSGSRFSSERVDAVLTCDEIGADSQKILRRHLPTLAALLSFADEYSGGTL